MSSTNAFSLVIPNKQLDVSTKCSGNGKVFRWERTDPFKGYLPPNPPLYNNPANFMDLDNGFATIPADGNYDVTLLFTFHHDGPRNNQFNI
jgi:hypothetical protein